MYGYITYNIDEYIEGAFPFLDQMSRVILGPFFLVVFTKIPRKSLLTPRTVAGVGNGGECGNRLILPRVFQKLC